MTYPVIVVPPNAHLLRSIHRHVSGKPFSWVYLGQSTGEFQQVARIFQGEGTYIDTTEEFHQTSQDLRDSYLAYLYSIGQELSSLRWWISSLSYRNSLFSKTFHQACYLNLAIDLVRTWRGPATLVLVVVDKAVRRAIKRNLSKDMRPKVHVFRSRQAPTIRLITDPARMCAHRAYFVLREGWRILASRWMVRERWKPEDGAVLLFCRVNPGNVHLGRAFDTSFFGELSQRLGEEMGPVVPVAMVSREVSYRQALQRVFDSSRPLLVPHRYLSILDVIRSAAATIARPPLPRRLPLFQGMDIAPLAKEDVDSDWVSNQAASALLMLHLIRRWADFGFSISEIIYIYENQPWERALCWETRRAFPEAALVGYQHARLSRLSMNWHIAPGGESVAPLPDRVVTIGRHTAKALSSGGWDPDRVMVGGALHIQRPFADGLGNGDPPSSGEDPMVLFAVGGGVEESVEMVETALGLFEEYDGIRVVVKCHPTMPFDRFKDLISAKLPERLVMSEEPITRLMQESSIMVYASSTVCVQALAMGLPTVYLRPRFALSVDPLEGAPETRLQATGLEDLRQKVAWLLEHRNEYVDQNKEKWDKLVDEFYGTVTEETFHAFVV